MGNPVYSIWSNSSDRNDRIYKKWLKVKLIFLFLYFLNFSYWLLIIVGFSRSIAWFYTNKKARTRSRKHALVQEKRTRLRKHALEQETDQENDQEKKKVFSFFSDAFLVESVFSWVSSFFLRQILFFLNWCAFSWMSACFFLFSYFLFFFYEFPVLQLLVRHCLYTCLSDTDVFTQTEHFVWISNTRTKWTSNRTRNRVGTWYLNTN